MSESSGLFENKSGHKTKVFLNPVSKIDKGVEGKKAIVETTVFGKTEKQRNGPLMFIKNYDSIGDAAEAQEKYEKLYDAFKKAKDEGRIDYIPLAPTSRRSGKRILSTDLTYGGQRVALDKHTTFSETVPKLNNLEDISEDIKKIADIASNDADMYLSRGSYCIFVDKDTGLGQLYITDLGLENLDMSNPQFSKHKESWLNKSIDQAHSFIERILRDQPDKNTN